MPIHTRKRSQVIYTYNNAGIIFIFFKPIMQPHKLLVLTYDGEVCFAELRQCSLYASNTLQMSSKAEQLFSLSLDKYYAYVCNQFDIAF